MIPLRNQALVGRKGERHTIQAAVDASTAGRGSALVIMGEGGIGKSRLCREAEGHALEVGAVVLSGRAVEGGPPEPFRPLAEAIASGFRAGGPPEDPSLLPFRGTLAHLIRGGRESLPRSCRLSPWAKRSFACWRSPPRIPVRCC